MRFIVYIASPWFVSLSFWLAFVACIDAPVPDTPPVPRVSVTWDPLACGEPHRIVLELVDDDRDLSSASAPCALGTLAVDVPHLGAYRGRIYAWELHQEAEIRSVTDFELIVDKPETRWLVQTPK